MNEKKTWNLIILVVNGQTLENLFGEDQKPLFPQFSHLRNLVSHVGPNNVCIVFHSVPEGSRQDEIDGLLRENRFYPDTEIRHSQLLFVSDADFASAAEKACTRFCKEPPHVHTVLISDNPEVLLRKDKKTRSQALLHVIPSDDDLESATSWVNLKCRLDKLLLDRL